MQADKSNTTQESSRTFSEETLDVRAVDWNRVWMAHKEKLPKKRKDKEFWNGRTAGFLKGAAETSYAEQFMALIKPEPSWRVFDMGCGTGTLAIPLAQRVSSVTAVDFSPGMLAALKDQADMAGVLNINPIEGNWEDDWSLLGIEPCDLAIASRSLVTADMRGSLEKLAAVATKRVAIVTITGNGPYDRALFEAIGRPVMLGPDYIYNYNMLYAMGIEANVAFITEERNRQYRDYEEAREAMGWMLTDLTDREEADLRAYFEGLPVKNDDGSPVIRHCTRVKWAVIWWDKSGKERT